MISDLTVELTLIALIKSFAITSIDLNLSLKNTINVKIDQNIWDLRI